jgi:hypothetical protein
MHVEDRLRGIYQTSLRLGRTVLAKPDEQWTYRAAAAALRCGACR